MAEEAAKFQDATLDTIAYGRVRECFEAALAEVVKFQTTLPEFQTDKEGKVHAQVKIVMDFALTEDSVSVTATCDTSPPKRIAVGGPLYRRRGKLMIWENEMHQQEPLPLMRAVKEGGGDA